MSIFTPAASFSRIPRQSFSLAGACSIMFITTGAPHMCDTPCEPIAEGIEKHVREGFDQGRKGDSTRGRTCDPIAEKIEVESVDRRHTWVPACIVFAYGAHVKKAWEGLRRGQIRWKDAPAS